MRLAAFIRANTKEIIKEWEEFARSLVPLSESKSPLALRDHIKEILDFISGDIESPQTHSEQVEKSRGEKPPASTPSAAEIHASLRHAGGFNMDQMVSEYRALRASIIKLWDAQLEGATRNDISDLTRFNESVDQALKESITDYSMRLTHSRNVFLGILSHDLRSPLGAISMSAKLTLMIGTLTERQTMLVSQIAESAERAAEIVSHLLDITRTRLGSGIPIVKAPMDMGFVTKLLVDEMRALHPSRFFQLDVSGELEGEWDKARIGQVLSNLLGNAVQYGFTGSPITVTVQGCPDEVMLSVKNEGVVIPSDTLGKIFDSLTRGELNEDGGHAESVNLGLGLYITKEIVIAHGGTIDVASSEKGGTVFTAHFPAYSSSTAPDEQAEAIQLIPA